MKKLVLVSSWPPESRELFDREALGARVIASDEGVQARLLASEVPAETLENFLDRSKVPPAEAAAWDCARNWHRDPQIDMRMRRGQHHPAELTELYLGNYLKWCYVKALELDACLTALQPEALTVVEQGSEGKGFFPGDDEPFLQKALRQEGRAFGVLMARKPSERGVRPNERIKQALRQSLRHLAQWTGCASWNGGRPRVAVVSAPQHVQTVVQALRGRAHMIHLDEEFRLAKVDFVRKNGMRYVSYPDLTKRFASKASAIRSVRVDGGAILSRIREAGLLTVAGKDLLPLAEVRVKRLLENAADETLCRAEVLGQWLEAEKIDAVVVDEDTVTFRKSLVHEADRRGIATIQVPHGVSLAGYHYDLFPVSSSIVTVGGKGIADFYRDNGVPAKKIRVTGVPRYDLWSRGLGDPGRLRQKMGIRPDEKVVLFGSTALFKLNIERRLSERARGVEDLITAARRLSGVVLAVRIHPLDPDPEATLGSIRKSGIRYVLADNSASAADWIHASDAVSSFVSNLVLESLVLGKPTIILDHFMQYPDHVPYFAGEGAWIRARSADAIEGLLRRSLDPSAPLADAVDRARTWLLENWVGPMDGGSGGRVADIVLEAARGAAERR